MRDDSIHYTFVQARPAKERCKSWRLFRRLVLGFSCRGRQVFAAWLVDGAGETKDAAALFPHLAKPVTC